MTIPAPRELSDKSVTKRNHESGSPQLSVAPFGDHRLYAILLPLMIITALFAVGYVLFYFYSHHSDCENIVRASGRIETTETHIRAPTATRVEFVAVNEGDNVHKGQLIVRLDSASLQKKISQSTPVLRKAMYAQQETDDQVAAVQNQINVARAKSHGFLAKLFSTRGGREKKEMQMRTEIMQAKMMSMKAHSAVSQVEDARTRALSKLSYFNITSPIDGICTIRSTQPGELVASGQIMLTFANPNSAYMRAFVPESDMALLNIGQTAKIFLDSASTKPLSGKVTSIDTEPSFTPENVYFKKDRERQAFGIKISINHPNGLAKPGMPAEATIALNSEKKEALMVISMSQPLIKRNSSEEQIVVVDHLYKRYRNGGEALKGINLNINKGDLFGLIGPDGAGKSTTLRLLAGVMEATSGTALILGKAPRDARQFITYVPQDCAFYSELTVEENLRYQAGLYGVSEQSFCQVRDKHLKNMGLLKFSDRLAANLSGGMKQKLALCCALVSQPQLVLLDEPSTGLDPIARRELWQELSTLAQKGVTVVIATPFLDEAERCNRIALMYEGKIHETGSLEQLQKALKMRRLEITLNDDPDTIEILNIIKSASYDCIKDIYLYGDALEILAQDVRAAESEIRGLLSKTKVAIQSIYETAPNMENVFVMRLRDLGLQESLTVPFPRIRTTESTVSPLTHSGIAVQAQSISKDFKDFCAVDKIQLEIRYGEIFGLLGANGAGKTTAIKMLCGLLEPSAGLITLAGRSKDLRNRDIRKRIGYMSQKFTLYDGLTVEENLQFYASIYEIPLKLRKQQIDWVTQVCELKDILKSMVGGLPLGWKQRIAFGAAVMHEPAIIFLDEPTAGVDPLARRQLWTLIRDFALNKAAILVSTHYLDEAEYCNRLAFMAAGKIVTQGSPRQIKSQLQGQVIEIRTSNREDACLALGSHLGQCNVSVFGDAIHVLIADLQTDLANVKVILQETRCGINSLRPIASTLEDAFIDIVQRSLGEAP